MSDIEVRVDVILSATFWMPKEATKEDIQNEVLNSLNINMKSNENLEDRTLGGWIEIEDTKVIKYIDGVGYVL
jgi:hypothetical protein